MQLPEQVAQYAIFCEPPETVHGGHIFEIYIAMLWSLGQAEAVGSPLEMSVFTREQRCLFALNELDSAIDKGGFEAYFTSLAGDSTGTARAALTAADMNAHASVFQAALEFFKGRDLGDRNDRLAAFRDMDDDDDESEAFFEPLDQQWRALDDAFERRVVAFIEANYAACFRPPS